ncbi:MULTISPECIES: ATP-grasp fold amidoligase family protein [unclassified Flavobacterium]|uniref:ATP-grasp fold amidoligase family protein n=1 Tax=unclassified Flavobacterium TaxID=196869 RepID=UPI00361C9083
MKFLPLKLYVPIQYESVTQKRLNLEKPETFNEKLQWYKVYYKNPSFHQLADKYNVRDYIKQKVGEQYLNDLLGVYKTPKEIDFEQLPEKFVLKCVHGSGFNLIVKNKKDICFKQTIKLLKKWQKKNYYNKGKEWSYKNIEPLIIAEKFLEDSKNKIINDYKFFCFNGEIKFIQVDLERKVNNFRCHYDTNWQKLPFYHEKNPFYTGEAEQPSNLEDMIYVAQTLSKDIPFVRVDLYSIDNKTIFGEMTFYPSNGTNPYLPLEYNKIIGNYFVLPNKI